MDSHKTIYMPAKMDSLNNEHIIDIASNYYNSLALTDSGKVNNEKFRNYNDSLYVLNNYL